MPDHDTPSTATAGTRKLLDISSSAGGKLPASYLPAYQPLAAGSHDHLLTGFDGDPRSLARGAAACVHAIYCSHTLEHFPLHEVQAILAGALHILVPGGFLHLRVPDIPALMRLVVERQLDLDSVLYRAGAGPVRVHDLLWGHAPSIAREGPDSSGQPGAAHRTGFSRRTLAGALQRAGFSISYSSEKRLELSVLAFKGTPDPVACALFNLTHVPKGTLQ